MFKSQIMHVGVHPEIYSIYTVHEKFLATVKLAMKNMSSVGQTSLKRNEQTIADHRNVNNSGQKFVFKSSWSSNIRFFINSQLYVLSKHLCHT